MPDRGTATEQPCPKCRGTGDVHGVRCWRCGGSGDLPASGPRTELRVLSWLVTVNTSPLSRAEIFGSFRQVTAGKPPVSHGTCQ